MLQTAHIDLVPPADHRTIPMTQPLRVTFHGIGEPARPISSDESRVWLCLDSFERALDAVAQAPGSVITFDDGNLSDYSIALPRLRERGLRATFFVCSGRLGVKGFLEVGHLRELIDAGMTIGSHGVAHIPWRGLGPETLRTEVAGSKATLEAALGVPVHDAACPFGAYDRAVLATLHESGYRSVSTSDGVGPTLGGWLHARTTISEANANDKAISRLRTSGALPRFSCAARTWIKAHR